MCCPRARQRNQAISVVTTANVPLHCWDETRKSTLRATANQSLTGSPLLVTVQVRPCCVAPSQTRRCHSPYRHQVTGGAACGSISASAARRSASPVAVVVTVPTSRPLRFSIRAWLMKHSRASLPNPLRNRRASGRWSRHACHCRAARRENPAHRCDPGPEDHRAVFLSKAFQACPGVQLSTRTSVPHPELKAVPIRLKSVGANLMAVCSKRTYLSAPERTASASIFAVHSWPETVDVACDQAKREKACGIAPVARLLACARTARAGSANEANPGITSCPLCQCPACHCCVLGSAKGDALQLDRRTTRNAKHHVCRLGRCVRADMGADQGTLVTELIAGTNRGSRCAA
jgi:hypothetical protein